MQIGENVGVFGAFLLLAFAQSVAGKQHSKLVLLH
jgi:hypothetical protein